MPVPAPLTFQQMWMWSLLRRYDAWKCVGSAGLRLTGKLNIPALERSLERIVTKHSSLRTRITLVDALPLQHTEDPGAYRLECVTVAVASKIKIEANARRVFA